MRFSPGVGLNKVPIVDAAICYDCPYTSTTYVLIARNVLYVPQMHINLVPPFILLEAGLVVHDTPTIHVVDPTVEDHSIYMPVEKLRIPLSLYGTFSYFSSRAPNDGDNIDEIDKIIITPDCEEWDPHRDTYGQQEDAMLDWEGEIAQPPPKRR